MYFYFANFATNMKMLQILHRKKDKYETRSHEMSIKSGSLNSAIPPQSCSRGVLCVIIEFRFFTFFNTLIILESNSVCSFC